MLRFEPRSRRKLRVVFAAKSPLLERYPKVNATNLDFDAWLAEVENINTYQRRYCSPTAVAVYGRSRWEQHHAEGMTPVDTDAPTSDTRMAHDVVATPVCRCTGALDSHAIAVAVDVSR